MEDTSQQEDTAWYWSGQKAAVREQKGCWGNVTFKQEQGPEATYKLWNERPQSQRGNNPPQSGTMHTRRLCGRNHRLTPLNDT